jgi:hypothetical protein
MPMPAEAQHAMLILARRKIRAAREFYTDLISVSAISAEEQAMIQLKTNSSTPSWRRHQGPFAAARERAAASVRAQSARIMRMLILVLVGLQLVLAGLMLLTGRVEVGAPIIGGILLIGFGAAQFGR